MERQSEEYTNSQTEVKLLPVKAEEAARVDLQEMKFSSSSNPSKSGKQDQQTKTQEESQPAKKKRYNLRNHSKACQTNILIPNSLPFEKPENLIGLTSSQSADVMDPVLKPIYDEIIEECRRYHSAKTPKYTTFEGKLSQYIRLSLWPEPFCELGKLLMENGIFVLAYVKFMAAKFGECRETLLLLYEKTVKTDKEQYEREVTNLKWATYERMHQLETGLQIKQKNAYSEYDSESPMFPEPKKNRPKLKTVSFKQKPKTVNTLTTVKMGRRKEPAKTKDGLNYHFWNDEETKRLFELSDQFAKQYPELKDRFPLIASEMGRSMSSVMNRYYYIKGKGVNFLSSIKKEQSIIEHPPTYSSQFTVGLEDPVKDIIRVLDKKYPRNEKDK